ncbi:MAG: DEAD/DEAH box helicase [Candidatus Jordarchaeum sp.]|uniref:DEAD/DEAH box helicase n=1 Tax=Candidatus Jordarchaeum sp. TaxID=2823881 RepID=UPI004049A2FE
MMVKPHEFLNEIQNSLSYNSQIEHVEVIPAKEAEFGMLDKPLPEPLQKYLDKLGIRLYSHQARAINEVRKGKNVIITTPTASGKTLCFNLPVLEKIHLDPKTTALYLYPLKALTNDQLKVLRQMEQETGIKFNANVYDGDTPPNLRPKIRKESNIILSNPYGIHLYLPWHNKWTKFYSNLAFIVLDEVHTYRGVFGSNVAMLMRRLLRICEHYGSNPQIILSSATIANPEELSSKLTGKQFEVVSEDGAVRGKKYFVFWNPPLIGRNARNSPHQETKNLLAMQVARGIQTLCFTISRRMAELIARWTREEIPELKERVTSYRAGYLPSERREIEKKLREKQLLGVASTSALELGIDIGSLDSVIISGYPGTIISTWQQAGRAGRGTEDALITLVAFENPLDQYFMKHPEKFFGKPHEHAIIDLENPYITIGHLMCAAAELPLKDSDAKYFSDLNVKKEHEDSSNLFSSALKILEENKVIMKSPKGFVYAGTRRAVDMVSLDSISSEQVKVVCEGKVLEIIDRNRAYSEAHRGAVFLHQGETYLVEDLDLNNRTAYVRKEDLDYYTEAAETADIEVIREFEKKLCNDFVVKLGEVTVTKCYNKYFVKKYDEVLGLEPLELPPIIFDTTALWFIIPDDVVKKVKENNLDFEGGIHAVEHAMIAMTPYFALCDRRDIGGVSTSNHPDTGKPTIFIYDGHQGGIGINEKNYQLFQELASNTLELIESCECEDGCPSCIYSPKCGNNNEPLDKKAATIILRALLKKPN